jgi:molybdate transport system substrate-binding protein
MRLYLLYCLFTCWLSLIPNAISAADTPMVAVASNLKFAIEDIAKAFHSETGQSVRFSFASSGNLSHQIQQGAPFALFLSANSRYVFQLQQAKLASDQSCVFALGQLALLTPKASSIELDKHLKGVEQAFKKGQLKRLAIANPDHAPYGIAAREILQSLHLWEPLHTTIVLGENVAQTAHYVGVGAAQAGLISSSLALAPGLRTRTKFLGLPTQLHSPLPQTAVLLSPVNETAEAFYRFLTSESARTILVRYGYLLP